MRRLRLGNIGPRIHRLLRDFGERLCDSPEPVPSHQTRVGLGLMELEQRRVLAAPVAIDDSYLFDPATSTSYIVPFDMGVLANDFDEDNDPLNAVLVDPPFDGQLFLNPDGSFEYIPGRNFSGFDSFTYMADDGIEFSNLAFVTIETSSGSTSPPPTTSPPSSFQVDTFEDTLTFIGGLSIGPFGSSPGVDFVAQLSVDTGSLPDGGLLFFGSLNGLTVLDGGDGTGFIEFSGSEQDINAALDTLAFLPALDFSGLDHLQFNYQSQAAAFPASGSTIVDIDVEAVADEPLLLVPDPIVYIDPGHPFPVPIDASSFDIDGSEDVFVVLSGVPEELDLSLGFERPGEPGTFDLQNEDWLFLDAIVQPGGPESFNLTITAVAVERDNNDSASVTYTVEVVRLPNDTPPPHQDDPFFSDPFYHDPFFNDPFFDDPFFDNDDFLGPAFGSPFFDDPFFVDPFFDFDNPDLPPPPVFNVNAGGPTGAGGPNAVGGSSNFRTVQHSGPGNRAVASGQTAPSSTGNRGPVATQSLGLVSNLRPQEIGRRNESLLRPSAQRGHQPIAGVTADTNREEITTYHNEETGLYARSLNSRGDAVEDVRLPDQLADDYSRFLKFLRELPNGDYLVYFRQSGQTLDQAALRQRLLEVRVVNGRLNPKADEFKPAGELSQGDGDPQRPETDSVNTEPEPKTAPAPKPVERINAAESVPLDPPVSGLIGVGVASQLARMARTLRSQRDQNYESFAKEGSRRGRKFRRRTNRSKASEQS